MSCSRVQATGLADDSGGHTTAAFVISATVHILLISVLGLYAITPEAPNDQTAFDSRWSVDLVDTVSDPRHSEIVVSELDATRSGGTTAVGQTLAMPNPSRVAEPFTSSSISRHHQLTASEMGQPVTGLLNGTSPSNPGTGAGISQGSGTGIGFFGSDTSVGSVVFVVDCSGSMNRPHDSEAKTRFRRLKFELINSIGNMKPTTRFFIVFFNDRAHPMPAPGLQWATIQVQQHYLKWMAKVPAGGQTDPRGALHQALLLRPEAIYFLTDGSFAHKIDQELLNLHQRRVAIHTFAFGDRGAENIMRALANNNGGRYHFVP